MGRRAATMPQRRMMSSDKLEEDELMRVYAQANQYAEELRQLYLERRATQAELEQKVRELERSQKQMLAYAHDLAGINRRLQTTYLQTLAALARTVDHRDGITGDHCLHVAEYSRILGARLEEQEWQVMRRHPELGCQMLEGIDFLEEALPIVRHHHERHDGEGYPDGLKGDAIPIGARIFAVADAFDAMTSDRHYRRARSVDHAVSELKRHSATQFDPQVIEVLETVAEELVSSHESRGAGSE